MSFEFDPEIERRLREAASRSNQDVADFARAALLRQLESMDTERKANREASLAREFAQAMSDPLFVADLEDHLPRVHQHCPEHRHRPSDHDQT